MDRDMKYNSAQDWRSAPSKRVMIFGMSGLGKTYLSNCLRDTGDWFHYSVDYRIGTRYMGEHIVDNFKKEAMRNPFLANLLRSDSIYVASNLSFADLSPLSSYLGKPGNPSKGGIEFDEYVTRQRQHRIAETSAMLDTSHFINRAKALYDYDHFICDTSGSMVEVVNPNDPNDPVLNAISKDLLPVWIEGNDSHVSELVARFAREPKPMYYQEDFLMTCWQEYLVEKDQSPADVDPDEFINWGFRRLLDHRLPRYRAIAENWGVTVQASDVSMVKTAADFDDLIADALAART
jgi:hypothetical protein